MCVCVSLWMGDILKGEIRKRHSYKIVLITRCFILKIAFDHKIFSFCTRACVV